MVGTGYLSFTKSIVETTKENGSFYIFYDKLQLIQARAIPKVLEDADCKLTLYRNCRNTENIAKTSLRAVNRSPKLMENCIIGVPAKLLYARDADETVSRVNHTIHSLWDDGIENIVLLTCVKESDSVLFSSLHNECYPINGKSIQFTTCRKFKGLEADAVILVDISEDTFLGNNGQNVLLFYAGASRARLRLAIVTTMDDSACISVLQHFGKTGRIKRPQRELAKFLNAVPVLDSSVVNVREMS